MKRVILAVFALSVCCNLMAMQKGEEAGVADDVKQSEVLSEDPDRRLCVDCLRQSNTLCELQQTLECLLPTCYADLIEEVGQKACALEKKDHAEALAAVNLWRQAQKRLKEIKALSQMKPSDCAPEECFSDQGDSVLAGGGGLCIAYMDMKNQRIIQVVGGIKGRAQLGRALTQLPPTSASGGSNSTQISRERLNIDIGELEGIADKKSPGGVVDAVHALMDGPCANSQLPSAQGTDSAATDSSAVQSDG